MGEIEKNDKWFSFLDGVMKISGVTVNRREYLTKEFKIYCDDDKFLKILEEGTDKAGISVEFMDKIAAGAIGLHSTLVTGTSFVAGVPGGFAMIGTIPADLAQYYFHVLQISQKLAYIYGWPDLEEGISDQFLMMITIFIGIMSGVGGANIALKTISLALSKMTVKKLTKMALTKTTIYPVIKKIASMLGIKLTKQMFAKGVGKIIPFVGGVISAGVTAAVFIPSANKLKEELHKNIYRYQV